MGSGESKPREGRAEVGSQWCHHAFHARKLSCTNSVTRRGLVEALERCGRFCQKLVVLEDAEPSDTALSPSDVHKITRETSPWVDSVIVHVCTYVQDQAIHELTDRPEMECLDVEAEEDSWTGLYVGLGLMTLGLILLLIAACFHWASSISARARSIFSRNGARATAARASVGYSARSGGQCILPLGGGLGPQPLPQPPSRLAIGN